MNTGVIKWFNETKGFGFVKDDASNEEYFVHYSKIQAKGFKTLKENDKVTFDIEDNNGKKQAVNVALV